MIWLGPFESHQTNLVKAAFLAGLKTALKDKIRIIVSDPKMQGESKAALSSFCEFREPENLDVAIDFFDDKYRIYLILDFSLNEPARSNLFRKLKPAVEKGIAGFLRCVRPQASGGLKGSFRNFLSVTLFPNL